MSEFTVKVVALVPLKFTAVAPVKFAPEIVTLVPTAPLVGEKLVMLGTGVPPVTVKLVALVAMPPPVVTLMVPLVVPAATVAVICVSEFTVNEEASVPLNVTIAAPVKLVPVMVTLVPTGPLVGAKLVMLGAGAVLPPASFLTRNAAAIVGSSAVKNV